MTGLNPREHHILEVAMIATDGDLSRTIDGPNLCVHHGEVILSSMNEWSQKQHGESGLTEQCRESAVTLAEAESALVDFVNAHGTSGYPALLAGACIYKDLEFIEVHMPRLRALLSHRVVDVSTVRTLCRVWYPNAARRARGTLGDSSDVSHRAYDDILYSIRELQYFRAQCFKEEGKSKGKNQNRPSSKSARGKPAGHHHGSHGGASAPTGVAKLVQSMDSASIEIA